MQKAVFPAVQYYLSGKRLSALLHLVGALETGSGIRNLCGWLGVIPWFYVRTTHVLGVRLELER